MWSWVLIYNMPHVNYRQANFWNDRVFCGYARGAAFLQKDPGSLLMAAFLGHLTDRAVVPQRGHNKTLQITCHPTLNELSQ